MLIIGCYYLSLSDSGGGQGVGCFNQTKHSIAREVYSALQLNNIQT